MGQPDRAPVCGTQAAWSALGWLLLSVSLDWAAHVHSSLSFLIGKREIEHNLTVVKLNELMYRLTEYTIVI